MTYKELVADIAKRSGQPVPIVKAVLAVTPDALLQLDDGELVRTPLGTFRMTKRNSRRIKLPDGPIASVGEKCVVRLKSGNRIKRDADLTPSPAPL